ncbi:MAG: TolC family protein [Bdellovibrionota bacterium]
MKPSSLILGMLLLPAPRANAEPLSLATVLNFSEENSHAVTAAVRHETASGEAVSVAQSYYFPTLDFEAIDSTGFPGSNGQLGIGGVMGSSFRSGLSYGLVAKANVWDFGRTTNAVSASEHEHLADRQKTRLHLIDIDSQAARVFFDCVRYRSHENTWAFVLDQAKLVTQEVRKFVSTGQRTVVERYLAESQEEEAVTSRAEFAERGAVAEERLRLYTGQKKLAACPTADQLNEKDFAVDSEDNNPWITNAREEASSAEAKARAARSDHMPKIVALGSVGYMNSVRLVAKKDYALGIGVTLPLFEGFRTLSKTREAEALAEEKAALVEASREDVDRSAEKFEDLLVSARVRLSHLVQEQKLAESGFELARKRYQSLQGPIVDVRESLRNLTRVKTQLNDARVDYWSALLAKQFFLGKRLVAQHAPVAYREPIPAEGDSSDRAPANITRDFNP